VRRNRIAEHYPSITPAHISRTIVEKSSRIAFLTTRFSTAIQYFARDCVHALKNLGYDARLIIEESSIAFNHEDIGFRCFGEFKPDIVFCIDNMRNVLSCIPEQAVFVCWIQDFMPELFSKACASKIGRLDFVMSLFYSGSELIELGYPSDRIIDAPIPVNPELYKKYDLTGEELELYSTDICYISNSGNMEVSLKKFMNYFKNFSNVSIWEKNFKNFADRIYNDIYNEKNDYCDIQLINNLLKKELEKSFFVLSQEAFAEIARFFIFDLISDMKKVVPLLWLHEKGYKMKLWGRPWPGHPILKKYAMGEAKNGETMSKILNASKISLGQNNAITLHPRLLEAILSESLYIGNNIPEKFDLASAGKYLNAGEDYVQFYGREDLYKKVDRYLADDGERKRIVKNGKEKILKSLTYEHLMKNVLKFIEEKLGR